MKTIELESNAPTGPGKVYKDTPIPVRQANKNQYQVILKEVNKPNLEYIVQAKTDQAARRKACAIARAEGYTVYEIKNEAGEYIYFGYRG